MTKIYTLDNTANRRSKIFLNKKRALPFKATLALTALLLVSAGVIALTTRVDSGGVATSNGNSTQASVARPSVAYRPVSIGQESVTASASTTSPATVALAHTEPDPQYFRASSADDLYAKVSIAMRCSDGDSTWIDSEICQGIPPKNARELKQLLSDAANAGAPAAQRFLAQDEADHSSEALDDAAAIDPALRAQGVERLQASVEKLQELALQTGDAHQLTQLSAVYSRNIENLADGAKLGAAWAMVAGLRTGQKASELESLLEAFTDDEATQVRKMVHQLSMRLPPAPPEREVAP
ncbi:hypothetical protein [Variovorax sp. YR266]|uniref:hypothetical protein n=1 Tax=Variovorax sp. YR266 TaxID=1884386 RepID=UPI00115FFBB7|nr:hypothetical protein [Variovorax sp. YR266]